MGLQRLDMIFGAGTGTDCGTREALLGSSGFLELSLSTSEKGATTGL